MESQNRTTFINEFYSHHNRSIELLRNLDGYERMTRNEIEQISDSEWRQRAIWLDAQKCATSDALRVVKSYASENGHKLRKRFARIRRSRAVRRKNRALHRRLRREAIVADSARVETHHRQACQEIEKQNENETIESKRALMHILTEICRKKQDLLALNRKVSSLRKYRSTFEQSSQGLSTSNQDDRTTEFFRPIDQKITDRLLHYNREESYIRRLLSSSEFIHSERIAKITRDDAPISISAAALVSNRHNTSRDYVHNATTLIIGEKWRAYVRPAAAAVVPSEPKKRVHDDVDDKKWRESSCVFKKSTDTTSGWIKYAISKVVQ